MDFWLVYLLFAGPILWLLRGLWVAAYRTFRDEFDSTQEMLGCLVVFIGTIAGIATLIEVVGG